MSIKVVQLYLGGSTHYIYMYICRETHYFVVYMSSNFPNLKSGGEELDLNSIDSTKDFAQGATILSFTFPRGRPFQELFTILATVCFDLQKVSANCLNRGVH